MRLRRLHRLLGLVIGIPSLLWGLSGALLAWKSWARDTKPPGAAAAGVPEFLAARRPFRVDVTAALAASGRSAVEPVAVEWRHLASRPYYVLRFPTPPKSVLVDGETGLAQAGIDEGLARQIASEVAPPGAQVVECRLQREPSLVYLGGSELPVFRVALTDRSDVYISPTSGEVFFRATQMNWVIRFAFYGLHVWKWSSGPGPHPSYLLLLVMGLLLFASGASGIWLWLPRRAGRSS